MSAQIFINRQVSLSLILVKYYKHENFDKQV